MQPILLPDISYPRRVFSLPRHRYRLAKWVMPKFRFTKSKILIEPAGAKSIDGEYSFRLRFSAV